MNITYKFKYRRFLFWRSEIVTGHQYLPEQEKMCLYFADGSVREIRKWKACEVHLGTDWVLATKERIKQETGKEL